MKCGGYGSEWRRIPASRIDNMSTEVRQIFRVMTTAVQLHIIMSVASNSQRPSGLEKKKTDRAGPGSTKSKRSTKARRCTVQQEMQFYVIAINTMMHVAGLIGTLVPADEVSKWMYWIFGCAMFAMIANQLTSTRGQICKVAKKNKALDVLRTLTRTTIATWALYPLMWAFADGSRTIQWEIKELLYIMLDLSAKFSFTLVLLVSCTRDVLPHACQVLHVSVLPFPFLSLARARPTIPGPASGSAMAVSGILAWELRGRYCRFCIVFVLLHI